MFDFKIGGPKSLILQNRRIKSAIKPNFLVSPSVSGSLDHLLSYSNSRVSSDIKWLQPPPDHSCG
jgi:hypothetical protein